MDIFPRKKSTQQVGNPPLSDATPPGSVGQTFVPGGTQNDQDPYIPHPRNEFAATGLGFADLDSPPVIKQIPSKKAWYTFTWFTDMPARKKLILLVPVVTVLIGGVTAAAFLATHKKDTPPPAKNPEPVAQKAVEPPKPATVASKLTGVQVAPELNQRGVTGVMIENSIDARPQSGLLDAGVVYEAIAEGGITRFLALFQESKPEYIGPVRSARPYYIHWLKPYGAAYAHVGGSNEALQLIKDQGIRDMNEFANANAYQRINSRFAPHNAYTGMTKLDDVRAKLKYDAPSFNGFARKAEQASKTPDATTINLNLSSVNFNVRYEYDAASNSYKRSEGGKPHTDEKSGKQLMPKVVVAIVSKYSIHADGIHSVYQTSGTGKVYVFQDGKVTTGTWSKNDINDQLRFVDGSGATLALNPGQTWVTAIGQESMVSYKAPVAPAAAP